MDSEWVEFRLGAVCTKIGSGATPRGGSSVYLATGEIALIRSQNVHNDGFHDDGLAFITPAHADLLGNVEVVSGDVLLNITGDSVARCCQVDPSVLPARVNQHVAIIRTDAHKLDPLFLRYALVSPRLQGYLLSWAAAGGTRNALTKEMIEDLVIVAPRSRSEQRAIAHILGTLDDKIELNRRMSGTLEGIARAIFKSWFVDFDPVRAKAEGRDPGLPKHLADLFPDRFVPSELGEIPEGWRVEQLSSLVDCVKGTSYRSTDLQDSRTALVTLKSFARGGGYRVDGLKPYIGEYKPEQVVHAGDLVVACTDVTQAAEVIGRPALVRNTREYATLVASLDIMVVRPLSSGLSIPFLYSLMRTDPFTAHTYAYSTGTTVLHLAKEAIPSFPLALPPQSIRATFDAVSSSVFQRIDAAETETESLAELRDTLLPKLISGELRVPDAENIVGEHT